MPDARGQEFRVLVKTVCHGFTRILADVAFSNFFLSVLIRICGERVASGAASASKKTMTAEANPSRVQVIHSETRTDASTQLREWLEHLLSRRGSDLLLVPQAPPAIRIEGALEAIGERALSGDEIEAAVVPAMAVARARRIPAEWHCRFFISSRGHRTVPHQLAPRTRARGGYGKSVAFGNSKN